MRKSKLRKIFGLGRRWLFTLALFVCVFALASAVKVEAASTIMGWLFGGSEDGNIGGSFGWPPDGNETGVGWVSMNNTNAGAGGSHAYSVVINDDNTISGYAWVDASNTPNSTISSEENGLGWIQFDPAPDNTNHGACGYPNSPCFSTKRVGDHFEGWARFVGIANEFAAGNSGGWEGWVKMHSYPGDPKDYGVSISGSNLSGYAWNGETPGTSPNMANGLGWISFNRATIEDVCALSITPFPSFSLGSSTTIEVSTITGSTPTPGKVISFTKAGTDPDKFNVPSSCTTGADGKCSINVTSVDRTSSWTATITAQNADCGVKSTDGTIIPVPTCVVTCDSSVNVARGGTVLYNVTATGSGCSSLRNCSVTSGSSKITSDWNSTEYKCEVTAAGDAKYDTAVSTSTAGTGPQSSCDTNVNVKAPGWIETNP